MSVEGKVIIFRERLLHYCLCGEYTDTSSGCSLLLQWGNVKRTTSFSLAKSMPSIEIWLSWLSINRSTGFSIVALVWPLQHFLVELNSTCLKFTLWNIIIGGMNESPALTVQIVVTRYPRSADITGRFTWLFCLQ